MEIKRYRLSDLMTEDYVRYDDIKHLLTRPDPAEVERLLDEFKNAVVYEQFALRDGSTNKPIKSVTDRLDKARSELLKLIYGGD